MPSNNDPLNDVHRTLCFVFESDQHALRQDDVRYQNVDLAIFRYLMRLWAFLTLTPVTPAGETLLGDKNAHSKMEVDGGWTIHVRGNQLTTSAGEHEHGFATTPFIRTARVMADMLGRQGVTHVLMGGMDVGAVAAWEACQNLGIAVPNFTPSEQHRIQMQALQKTPVFTTPQPRT